MRKLVLIALSVAALSGCAGFNVSGSITATYNTNAVVQTSSVVAQPAK